MRPYVSYALHSAFIPLILAGCSNTPGYFGLYEWYDMGQTVPLRSVEINYLSPDDAKLAFGKSGFAASTVLKDGKCAVYVPQKVEICTLRHEVYCHCFGWNHKYPSDDCGECK